MDVGASPTSTIYRPMVMLESVKTASGAIEGSTVGSEWGCRGCICDVVREGSKEGRTYEGSMDSTVGVLASALAEVAVLPARMVATGEGWGT